MVADQREVGFGDVAFGLAAALPLRLDHVGEARFAPAELERRVVAQAHVLPRARAEAAQALVLDQTGIGRYLVGMVDPGSLEASGAVARALHTVTQMVTFVRLESEEWASLFALAYGGAGEDEQQRARARLASSWLEGVSPGPQPAEAEPPVELSEADSQYGWNERAGEATMRDFCRQLLLEGYVAGASDIHVECRRIRFRCDSLLYPKWVDLPEQWGRQLVNALAGMAGVRQERLQFEPYESAIRIAVRRRDGSAVRTKYRVEFLPTEPWPQAVLRLQVDPITELERIGFEGQQLAQVREGLGLVRGLVLVTGPTNSGKSNSLEAIYAYYERDDSLKVVEIADPPEFASARRTQVRITETCSWETAIKAALRSDPNLISPAECRDARVAKQVVAAALTGHIVPTTLHSGDVAGALTRLSEMGIAPDFQANSLNMIISQSLVRLLCPECKQIDANESRRWGVTVYGSSSCGHCYGIGYRGQTAACEVLLIRPEIKTWILSGLGGAEIVERSRERGWLLTMREAAEAKVRRGETSPFEVERVLRLSLEAEEARPALVA